MAITLPASRETNWDVKLNNALSTLSANIDAQTAQLVTITNTLSAMQATLTALSASVGGGIVWQA